MSKRLLPELEKAIQAKGGPIRVLYGVSIQDAIARGDQAEIARLKGRSGLLQSLVVIRFSRFFVMLSRTPNFIDHYQVKPAKLTTKKRKKIENFFFF